MTRYYFLVFMLLMQFQIFAQGLSITGTVTGAGDKLSMPGVSVVEKGTTNGVITNIDGKYQIKVSGKNAVLSFSFIGFQTLEIPVKGEKVINVVLEEANQKLNEVLVLGYGSVKSREAVVGSVEQVKSEELLSHSNAPSVDQMLEGQVAGVQIESETGDPTAPVKVRIRGNSSLPDMGASSFTASSEPLYILDGVPLVDALNPNVNTGAGLNAETVVNPLALINPEDIASISILKDASSAAIYGANAANGVVIITTKKGSKGKTHISFSQKMIYSTPINKIKYLNTDQYVELASEFYRNGGYAEDAIPILVGPTDIYTNWRDLTLQDAVSHKSNFSISGGSDKITYRLSLGYNDNETNTKGNDYKSVTSRLSISAELYDGVKLTYDGGLTSFIRDSYSAFASYSYKPNISVYDENGDFTYIDRLANPIADLEQNINESKKFYSNNSLKLNVRITKNLTSSSTFGIDYTNTKNFIFYSRENGKGANKGGLIKQKLSDNNNWIGFTQLEYKNSFAKHSVGAIVGFQLKHDMNTKTSTEDSHLITEKIITPGSGPVEYQKVSGYESESAMRSYYGRANYDFSKRYFLSVNVRSDASSFFGGDQKVENFASMGGSWILSKESFWPENDFINFLKFKASYGKVGNAKVGAYSARGLYGYSTSSTYNGKLIATPNTAPNEDLGWQKSLKFNAGITMKLLKRFNLDLEYYRNKTKDGIMSMKVIPETGWNSISVNAADITNQGFEASLKVNSVNIGELKWNSNFNIGFNRNRLDKLANGVDIRSSSRGLIVGKSTSLIMGRRYGGVNPENGNLQWILKDGTLTDDYSLVSGNPDEYVVLGKRDADFSGGFSNRLQYKNFSLSCMITYEYGADMFLPYPAVDAEKSRTLDIFNKSINLIDRWQKPGDITDVPKLSRNGAFDSRSSYFLHDKSNISFKSVSLKYNVPKSICKSINLKTASLGLNVSNIYTWYREKGVDGRNNIGEYRYPFPQSRMYAFDLKIGI